MAFDPEQLALVFEKSRGRCTHGEEIPYTP